MKYRFYFIQSNFVYYKVLGSLRVVLFVSFSRFDLDLLVDTGSSLFDIVTTRVKIHLGHFQDLPSRSLFDKNLFIGTYFNFLNIYVYTCVSRQPQSLIFEPQNLQSVRKTLKKTWRNKWRNI